MSGGKPLAIDLFCGFGGWTDGLLAEGWDVVGFDIERHEYGNHRYPAQLVLQDVLTLHGSQFRDADLIVASPPCQEFSYMAMPWSKAKAKIGVIEACPTEWLRLCALFDACFRIQREACAAAGRHIPLIVENVRGAQRWVGRSCWNFGSFHLWGDVPALMPMTVGRKMQSGLHLDQYEKTGKGLSDWTMKAIKNPGFRFDGSGRSMQSESVDRHIKNTGGSWFAVAHNTTSGKGRNPDGRKQPGISGPRDNGKGDAWFQDGAARHGSKSIARKAASAMIAKIPLPLSRYIGRTFKSERAAA